MNNNNTMPRTVDRLRRSAMLILLLGGFAALAGCGGGGGGGSSDDPANQSPAVDAGAARTVNEQTPVTLQGTATDADGTIASYQWVQTGGVVVSLTDTGTPQASFTAPTTTVQATLRFRLTAVDDDGASASDEVTITVQPVNQAPVADAGADQSVDALTEVLLDASGSIDGDGAIVAYQWAQQSGAMVFINGATSALATFNAPTAEAQPQTLEIQLTVTDNEGAQAVDTVQVTINPTELPTFDPVGDKVALEGQLLAFVVRASDPDGPPPSLSADTSDLPADHDARFVDHGDGSGTFTWRSQPGDAAAGPYSVRLTATDALVPGASADQLVSVDVRTLQGAGIVLADDFSDGSLAGWSFVNDTARSGTWQESGGRMSQSNLTEDLDQAYGLGSFAVLSASLGLSDYLFSVELIPQSETGLDVGALFRYRDRDNYYRISFNANNGYVRLEKRSGGTFSTLAANSRGYQPDDPIQLAVLVVDDRIQVFAGGEPLFAARDADHGTGGVALYNQDDAAYDNLIVADPPAEPLLGIERPIAHSLTPGGPLDLSVSAIAFNQPPSGVSLTVELNGVGCDPLAENPDDVFTGICIGVEPGDYTLTTVLAVDGIEVARDSSESVGVGTWGGDGHRYDALGNSLTEAIDDNYSTDNLALADGRSRAVRGWTGPLGDLLSVAETAPSLVSNEGVSGDTTQEYFDLRLPAVLERNPLSDRALVLLGTNDSNPFPGVPIGGGCSGAGCNGTVKGNLLAIVDALQAAGRERVYVGLLPPAWGDGVNSTPYNDPLSGARNLRVQAINDVIADEIVPVRAVAALGPDLFTCFLSPTVNRSSLFQDNLHPNGLGTAQLAQLWLEALTEGPPVPGAPCSLPLYAVENLQPSGYKQNLLEVGDEYYADQPFTLTAIPPALAGAVWLMTELADAGRADADFMIFDVGPTPVTVYVAYDPLGVPPLSTTHLFTAVTLSSNIEASGGNVTEFALVRAEGVTGTIRLGGNRSGGAPLARETYLVIVVP